MSDHPKAQPPQVGDVLNDPGHPFHGATFISVYTRAQAIADGVLVDLAPLSPHYGIKLPLAMTDTAWGDALCEPRPDRMPQCFDIGRFLDWLRAVITALPDKSLSQFEAPFTRIDHAVVRLKIVCGPGDCAEPVLTVMLPDED